MALKCFYVVNGEPAGPVTEEELLGLGRSRAIPDENLVWIEGTPDWQPFAKWVDQLESASPAIAEIPAPAPTPIAAPAAESSPPPVTEPANVGRDSVVVEREQPPNQAEAGSKDTSPSAGGWFRKISWTSLALLVAAVGASFAAVIFGLSKSGPAKFLATGAYWLSASGMLGSLICAIVGVIGYFRHRKWTILAPALAALILTGILLVYALPGISRARERAGAAARATDLAPAKPMSPVQSVTGAQRISHPTLDFSFDVPAGFAEFLPSSSTFKFWKVFGRPAVPGELADVFGIRPLGAKLPRRHLESKDIPDGKNAEISRISWRGTMVDAFRLSETTNGKTYIQYNVQIPLKNEAIQLTFGAPAERETELKARVDTLLASLDGSSDW